MVNYILTMNPPTLTREVPTQGFARGIPNAEFRVDESGPEGIAIVRLFQFGVVNSYDEFMTPGCVGEDQRCQVSPYGHEYFRVPVGRAAMYEVEDDGVYARLEYNLKNPSAEEAWNAVAFAGSIQEYSYIFFPLREEMATLDGERVWQISAMRIIEVSPVAVGSNPGTMTVSMRDAGRQEPPAPEPEPDIITPDDGDFELILDRARFLITED